MFLLYFVSRPSSSLAGHYNYLGDSATNSNANLQPDYANLTSISRRNNALYRQSSLQNDYEYEMQERYNHDALASNGVGGGMERFSETRNGYLTAPANDLDSFSPSSYGTNESFGSMSRNTNSGVHSTAYMRGLAGNGIYDSLPRGYGSTMNNANNASTTTSILKNGRAGRHLSSTYDYQNQNNTTVLRPLKGLYHDEADFSDPLQQNGYGGGYNNGYGDTTGNGGNRSMYDQQTFGSNTNSADVTTRLLEDTDSSNHLKEKNANKDPNKLSGDSGETSELPEDAYPSIAKPSASMQIIATRNRPCCECVRNDQRAPVCLLFIIFLVVSVSVISGVMVYLKSGIGVTSG